MRFRYNHNLLPCIFLPNQFVIRDRGWESMTISKSDLLLVIDYRTRFKVFVKTLLGTREKKIGDDLIFFLFLLSIHK